MNKWLKFKKGDFVKFDYHEQTGYGVVLEINAPASIIIELAKPTSFYSQIVYKRLYLDPEDLTRIA